jgi:hypothetical protein
MPLQQEPQGHHCRNGPRRCCNKFAAGTGGAARGILRGRTAAAAAAAAARGGRLAGYSGSRRAQARHGAVVQGLDRTTGEARGRSDGRVRGAGGRIDKVQNRVHQCHVFADRHAHGCIDNVPSDNLGTRRRRERSLVIVVSGAGRDEPVDIECYIQFSILRLATKMTAVSGNGTVSGKFGTIPQGSSFERFPTGNQINNAATLWVCGLEEQTQDGQPSSVHFLVDHVKVGTKVGTVKRVVTSSMNVKLLSYPLHVVEAWDRHLRRGAATGSVPVDLHDMVINYVRCVIKCACTRLQKCDKRAIVSTYTKIILLIEINKRRSKGSRKHKQK